MRNSLEGKQVYIDTNVLGYVALAHSFFASPCERVLRMISTGKAEGYGSLYIAYELFGFLLGH